MMKRCQVHIASCQQIVDKHNEEQEKDRDGMYSIKS